MSEDIQFSKKGQRKVSSFIGQELLYDFMTGNLDSERRKAVEEYIDQNKEVQGDIQKIQHGMNYLEVLEQTKVSEALVEKIKQPTSYLDNLLLKMKFDDWSPGFKLGVEASVVAIGITVIAVVLPWKKMLDFRVDSSDIILSEITKKFDSKNPAEKEITAKSDELIDKEKADISFPDEESGAAATAGAGAVIAASSTTTTSTTLKSAPAVAVVNNTTTTTMAANPAGETKRVGYLFRGTVAITNAKAAASKLVEKVTSLGGRKAGNVELGWSKDNEGAYFHFTMPESNYQQMTEAFQEYGQLKIAKERHDRVMPEGIVRVIITVDEKK